MKIEQIKLQNELNTLFIHSPGCSAGTVQIWFRAGSALETRDDQGIAHFLEHMFFKGTPQRPGPTLAHEIESFGGEVNAFTSFDYTCYYINTPSTSLDKSVDILLDMVTDPLFGEEEIPAERQVVHEEYRRATDSPNQYHFIQLQKSCFTGKYAHPILGREETILNFSRDQIKDFRKNYYNLENALLVVAGDLKNRKDLEDKISTYKLPSGMESQFDEFRLNEKESINIHEKDIRQGTLSLCFQSPNYLHEKSAGQDLSINCLAHGETSRLYQALVANSSLCNGVSGSTMYFARGGTHMIKISFPIENLSKLASNFLKVLSDVLLNGFKGEELNKIKNQYISSKIYEKESIESFAFSLGHGFAQTGNIFCEEEFIEKIRLASVDDVKKGLLEIFTLPSHFTLQVPKGTNIKEQEKILKNWQKEMRKKAAEVQKQKIKRIAAKTSAFDSAVYETELAPGIRFIYRQNKLTPTFVLHAYMKGGQSVETSQNAGIHHLIGRLINYGYQNVSYEKLKNELESLSSSLNGFSGKNAYGLTLHGQTKDFFKLSDHFFGTLMNPTFEKKYFEHEKKIILRALDNQKEDPVKQAFKAFYKMVFNQHPYSLDLAGTPETLKKFSATNLKKLHSLNLKNSPIVLTYCGDQDYAFIHEHLVEAIKQLGARKSLKAKIKQPKGLLGQTKHLEFKREQTQIVIGAPAFSLNKKEDLYLKMITAHLSGQSSELFVEVRDKKGLCYSVSPVHVSALEAGCWGIYIGCGHDKTDLAIEAILQILKNIAEKGIKKEEFDRIKKMIDGQNLLSIQTNEDYAQFYSIPVLHNLGLDFSHNNNELIRKTRYEDFQKFLKTFFARKWNIVQAGPRA